MDLHKKTAWVAGASPICISKGGMRMMMRNLAIELAPLGITVMVVDGGLLWNYAEQ